MILSGELKQLLDHDGVSGVTSNPAIFEKAIADSNDYDADILALALEDKSVEEIYETLTVLDIRHAADVFREVYDESEGRDGYVSLEVSPLLAHDTTATIAEARHLWKAVGRPNIFIKVPGTAAGLPAIQQLLTEGININVTLLFGLPRYRQVLDAYQAAMEARLGEAKPSQSVASVASFFLSRIDVLVDPVLELIIKGGGPKAQVAQRLRGQVAIACAKTAYQIFQETVASPRFQKLAAAGVRPQRLLWASTSTKNPDYPDTKYVEPLIGPQTINTMPRETLAAYRDHGRPAARLADGAAEAAEMLQQLSELDISLEKVTQQLEEEGVAKFVKPFEQLRETLNQAREDARRGVSVASS